MSELKLRFVMWSVWFGLVVMCVPCVALGQAAGDAGWAFYGGDADGARHSTAAQITRDNVSRLKVAWTYRTEALAVQTDLNHKAAFEATPILVDGMLYLSTPYDHVLALDAKSGTKAWEFDPKLDLWHGYSEVTSRGVSALRDAKAKADGVCALRIFVGTLDARLIALDGKTGERCTDFGSGGQVDLTRDVDLQDVGDYQVTSAPTIVKIPSW